MVDDKRDCLLATSGMTWKMLSRFDLRGCCLQNALAELMVWPRINRSSLKHAAGVSWMGLHTTAHRSRC